MWVTFITLLWVSCWPGHRSAGVKGQCSDLSLCYTTQERTFGGCLRSQRSIYRSTDLCLYCMCASIYPSATNDAFLLWKGNGSQSGWVDLKGIVHPKNKTHHLFQTRMTHFSFFGLFWVTHSFKVTWSAFEVILCVSADSVFDRRFTAANIVCLSGFLWLKSSRGWLMVFCSHNICDVSALTAALCLSALVPHCVQCLLFL